MLLKYSIPLISLMFIFGCSGNEQRTEPIKIMTYNIRYDNPNDGINAWPNRKNLVVQLIKKYDPDIIGIQESLLHQVEFLDSALEGYKWYGVGRDDGSNAGEFSPIFYKSDKYDLLMDSTIWLSESPEKVSKGWDAALPRIATICKFASKTGSNEFLVINTHFDHRGDTARINSAKLLVKLARDFNHRHNMIIGDLNAKPESKPIQTILNSNEFGLEDSFNKSNTSPKGPTATFSGFEEKPSFEENRIDYIFVSDYLNVLDFQIIDDANNGFYPSDHLPVMANVIIRTDK